LFGVEGMHVLDVTRDPDVGGGQGLVVLDVESDADLTGCPDRGVIAAVGHGRHVQVLHDAPCFGTPVRVRWRKRISRCPEPRVVKGPGPRSTTSRRRGPSSPAHGFRNFTNYRIRILLAADGTRPCRRPPAKTRSAERADPG